MARNSYIQLEINWYRRNKGRNPGEIEKPHGISLDSEIPIWTYPERWPIQWQQWWASSHYGWCRWLPCGPNSGFAPAVPTVPGTSSSIDEDSRQCTARRRHERVWTTNRQEHWTTDRESTGPHSRMYAKVNPRIYAKMEWLARSIFSTQIVPSKAPARNVGGIRNFEILW